MTRLDTLKWERDGLRKRMQACESDQNYAVMGRLLNDVLAQIDEIEQPQQRKETSLSEFERRLRDRQQGTKTARRAKSS